MAPNADVGVQHLAPSTYDRWFDSSWGRYAFSIESNAVLDALDSISPGTKVLDAGCGTGRFTRLLETSEATVVGTDLDPEMLEIASRRIRGPLVEADAERLPFPDGAFDQVVAVTLCEFVNDPGAVFAELARVTRPGGRIVVGSLNPRSPWGMFKRHRLRRAPWSRAHFLKRRELHALAIPFGQVSILGSLYAPEQFAGSPIFGRMLERIGRLVPTFGAFQVTTVERGDS